MIQTGFDKVESSIWFETIENTPSRQTGQSSYSLNLGRKPYRTDIRNYSFSSRDVEPWKQITYRTGTKNCEIFQGWSGQDY